MVQYFWCLGQSRTQDTVRSRYLTWEEAKRSKAVNISNTSLRERSTYAVVHMTLEVSENFESSSQRVWMCMSSVLSSSTRGLYLAHRASAVICSSEMTSRGSLQGQADEGSTLFSSLSVRLKNENRICRPLVRNAPRAAMWRGEK